MTIISDSGEPMTFYEMIMPGALDKCILSDCICCFDHIPSNLLGRYPNTLRLTIDKEALKYECDLPPLQLSEDLKIYVSRGDIRGGSWLMRVNKAKDEWVRLMSGQIVRKIHEITHLFDVGPVVRPVYNQTHVAARSFTEHSLNTEGLTPDVPPLPTPTARAEARKRTILANERAIKLLTL